MFRSSRLSRFLFAVATLCLLAITEAEAGLLKKLLNETGEAASTAGKHLDDAAKLVDEGAAIAKKLPKSADSAGVALVPAKDGTWQLVNAEGKTIPVSSLEDLKQGVEDASRVHVRPLAGDAAAAGAVKASTVQLAIRETDFFKLRGQLNDLPANTHPVLVRPNGRSYALKPVHIGKQRQLAVELSPNVLLDPATSRALDGNIKFLSRPVNGSNLRLARFDSASAAAQAPGPAETIVDLNADLLEASLARHKNRTLAVSGQVTRDLKTGRRQLMVRDGKDLRQIDLDAFLTAAERQRVDLMIVESASPVQPGKSWFSKTALEKHFAAGQPAMTQADLLIAVSPPNATTLVHAADERNYRLVTATSHVPLETSPQAATSTDGTSLAGWLLDAAMRLKVRSVTSDHEDPEHTDEVESRWIPWISNVSLILNGVMAALSAFLCWYLWGWWNGVWRYFSARSGGSRPHSPLMRVVKVLLFVPFAFLMAVPALLWLVIADWTKFLTWPFRKMIGRA